MPVLEPRTWIQIPVLPLRCCCSLSHVWLFVTPWTAARQAPLSSTVSWNSLKFMFIESVMLSNRLIFSATFSSCLQSFPASGSFPVSRLFTSGGQSIRASASDLSTNIRGWFPLRLTGLISLLSKGLLRVFSSTTIQKYQYFGTQPSLWSNSHIRRWLWKNHSFDYTDYTKWCLWFSICCLGLS